MKIDITDIDTNDLSLKKNETRQETNNLFPVFLKLEQLNVLIVGGGAVGLEKLNAVLQNSPSTSIKLVGITINQEIKELAAKNENIVLTERAFMPPDLEGVDLVILAIDDKQASQSIRQQAKVKGKLINVADTPDLCDFYLGSVVRKGNLKIAISTNGKSPTVAKRLKETLNELLPDHLESVLDNMQNIRRKLSGDFATKIEKLNDITKILATKESKDFQKSKTKKWKRVIFYSLFACVFIMLGWLLHEFSS